VAALCVSGDAEKGTASIINPVWRKEAAKGGNKGATTIILDSLRESTQLGGGLDEAEVIDEELDTRSGDSNAALERVHGLARAKVEGDSGQQTVGGDDGLGADVVQEEAPGAICVLGQAGCEALLTDESGGLVAEAASDLGALEGRVGEGAKGLGIGGADNLWQLDLVTVEAEPVQQLSIILERLEVHEHGARGIGGVRDVDVLGGAAVELVGEPGVNGAERKVTALVRLLDLGDVFEQPEELADRGVGGQGKATATSQLLGAEAVLEAADELLGAGVGPDDGVVKSLSSCLVPDNGGLTLVGDADGGDLAAGVALLLKGGNGAVDALLDRCYDFFGIMFMPTGKRKD